MYYIAHDLIADGIQINDNNFSFLVNKNSQNIKVSSTYYYLVIYFFESLHKRFRLHILLLVAIHFVLFLSKIFVKF